MSLQLADLLIFALYAITTVLLVGWARRSARAAEESAQSAKRSADAAERSTAIAEAQIQLDNKRAQPVLVRDRTSGKAHAYRSFDLRNLGGRVTSVKLLEVRGQLELELTPQRLLDKDGILTVDVKTAGAGWFKLGYTDRNQKRGSVWVYTDGSSKIIAREAGQAPVSDSELAEWIADKST